MIRIYGICLIFVVFITAFLLKEGRNRSERVILNEPENIPAVYKNNVDFTHKEGLYNLSKKNHILSPSTARTNNLIRSKKAALTFDADDDAYRYDNGTERNSGLNMDATETLHSFDNSEEKNVGPTINADTLINYFDNGPEKQKGEDISAESDDYNYDNHLAQNKGPTLNADDEDI